MRINDDLELLMEVAEWWIKLHAIDHFKKALKIREMVKSGKYGGGLIANSLLSESVYIHHSYRGYGIFHRNSSHASGCIVCLNKLHSFRCGAINVVIILGI